MRSQATAADLNKYMLGLTKKSVDDSATVRVVGIVSLIYLPATFTAVSTLLYPAHINSRARISYGLS